MLTHLQYALHDDVRYSRCAGIAQALVIHGIYNIMSTSGAVYNSIRTIYIT
jgi:hypothetical protein